MKLIQALAKADTKYGWVARAEDRILSGEVSYAGGPMHYFFRGLGAYTVRCFQLETILQRIMTVDPEILESEQWMIERFGGEGC